MKIISILISSLLLSANTCKKKQEEGMTQQEQNTTESVAETTTKDVDSAANLMDAVKNDTKQATSTSETPKLILTQGNDVKSKDTNQEIQILAQYEAMSRGIFLKVKYAGNQILVFKDRSNEKSGKTITLTKTQSDELSKLFQVITPSGLETMKAPTDARLYDGAAHANLSINSKGQTYSCPGFDHGHPPAGIEKFVAKLLSYTQDK